MGAAIWLPLLFILGGEIMPKVRMLQSMAGLTFSYVPGDEIEVRDDVAEAWEKADIAEIIPEEKTKKAVKKGDK
jgi:hypothetical protein